MERCVFFFQYATREREANGKASYTRAAEGFGLIWVETMTITGLERIGMAIERLPRWICHGAGRATVAQMCIYMMMVLSESETRAVIGFSEKNRSRCIPETGLRSTGTCFQARRVYRCLGLAAKIVSTRVSVRTIPPKKRFSGNRARPLLLGSHSYGNIGGEHRTIYWEVAATEHAGPGCRANQ